MKTKFGRSFSATCTLACAALFSHVASAEPIHAFQVNATHTGVNHWLFHPVSPLTSYDSYDERTPPVDTSQGDTYSVDGNGQNVAVGSSSFGSIPTVGTTNSDSSCAFYDASGGGRQMVVNYYRDITHLDDSWSSNGVNWGAGSWDPASGGVLTDGTPIRAYAGVPGTAARERGRIDMFALAWLPNDGSLHLLNRHWTASGSTNWSNFLSTSTLQDNSYSPIDSPVAISWRLWGEDRVDVFWLARGTNNQGSLAHAWTTYNLNSVDSWDSWGDANEANVYTDAQLLASPVVVSPRENQIDAYALVKGTYHSPDHGNFVSPTIIRWSWNNGVFTKTYLDMVNGDFNQPNEQATPWIKVDAPPYDYRLSMALFQQGGAASWDPVDYSYWMAAADIVNHAGNPLSILVGHETTGLGLGGSVGHYVTLCSEPLY
jgi:hypothetical protein